MYVAASTRCFADKSLTEACRLITDLEFDKVELWLDESGEHLKPSEVAASADRCLARFRESGRLSAVALCLADHIDAAGLAALARLSKPLRITQITLPAAVLGTPFNTEIDRLRRLAGVAGRDGIRLSLNTQVGRLTEDPHTAVELCQAVEGLGLTLDPTCYLCGPHRGRAYDQVFPSVYHVHLRDSTAEREQVPVGSGEIDYSRLINQLRRTGYNQALSVDIRPDGNDEEARALELRKLRMLLETLL